jgi:two-component system chemotaxis response regulator CheB
MPGAAIARGVVDHVVHGDELASALVRLARGQDPVRKG